MSNSMRRLIIPIAPVPEADAAVSGTPVFVRFLVLSHVCMDDMFNRLSVVLVTSGAPNPIVSFRQSRSSEFTQSGRGVCVSFAVAFASRATVSLYPSSVSAMLLAR